MKHLIIILSFFSLSCNQDSNKSDQETSPVSEIEISVDTTAYDMNLADSVTPINIYTPITFIDKVLIEYKEVYDDNFEEVLSLTVTNPFKKSIRSILIVDNLETNSSSQEIVLKGTLKPGQTKVHTLSSRIQYQYPLKAILVKFTDGSEEAANDPRDFFDWKVKKRIPY